MSVNQRLREMAAHDRALQRAAEDERYLGERPDPEFLSDDAIITEIREGDQHRHAAGVEDRARALRNAAEAAALMMDAARADAAWGRRHAALRAEMHRRARAELDRRTNARLRGRAVRLRQVWLQNGGDRTRSDTPPRYLPWDELPLHEAAAWAAIAIEAGPR